MSRSKLMVVCGAVLLAGCGALTSDPAARDRAGDDLADVPPGQPGTLSPALTAGIKVKVTLVADGLPSNVVVNTAEVMIRDVRLRGGAGDVGPRVWHAVTLASPVEFAFDAPDGCYAELRLKYEPLEAWNVGPTGRKVTAVVKGTVDGTPFELRSDVYAGADYCGAQGPICASSASSTQIDLKVDVGAWLAGVNLAQAPSRDGIIYLDDRNHSGVSEVFGGHIKNAGGEAGTCRGVTEVGGPGAPCTTADSCVSQVCTAGVCEGGLPDGSSCTAANQCTSGACVGGTCVLPKGNGEGCTVNDECQSQHCVNQICEGTAPNGAPCTQNSDCASNTCTAGTCESGVIN